MKTPTLTPEESELKHSVFETLQQNGVIANIKAQVRAAVFQAIDNQAKAVDRKGVLDTADGEVMVALFTDFLQIHALDHTLAVFQPECNMQQKTKTRTQVCESLKLPSNPAEDKPLLLDLIALVRERTSESKEKGTIETQTSIQYAETARNNKQPHSSTVEETPNDSTSVKRDETEDVVKNSLSKDVLAEESYESSVDKSFVEDPDSSAAEESFIDNTPTKLDEDEDETEKSLDKIRAEESYENSFDKSFAEEPNSFVVNETLTTKTPAQLDEVEDVLEKSLDKDLREAESDENSFDKSFIESHEKETSQDSDAAAQLSSIEEKLRAMEKEDDTGTLRQLKESLSASPKETPSASVVPPPAPADTLDHDPIVEKRPETAKSDKSADDPYGSEDFEDDFEEDVESIPDEVSSMEEIIEEEEEEEEDEPEGDQPLSELDKKVRGSQELDENFDYIEPVQLPT